jgi:hypothetical protein
VPLALLVKRSNVAAVSELSAETSLSDSQAPEVLNNPITNIKTTNEILNSFVPFMIASPHLIKILDT